MAPRVGLEPTIQRLTAACLAIRPPGNKILREKDTLAVQTLYLLSGFTLHLSAIFLNFIEQVCSYPVSRGRDLNPYITTYEDVELPVLYPATQSANHLY